MLPIGDWNARVGQRHPCLWSLDSDEAVFATRASTDGVVNAHGNEALGVAAAARLVILNGLRQLGTRALQDDMFPAGPTFYPPRARGVVQPQSVIDLGMVSVSLAARVTSCLIGDRIVGCDHRPVRVTLTIPPPLSSPAPAAAPAAAPGRP